MIRRTPRASVVHLDRRLPHESSLPPPPRRKASAMASTRRRTDGARRMAGLSRIFFSALAHRVASVGRRRPPDKPRRILVAHHLLLGDTLMLTPLLAKLREQFPAAEIVMAVPGAHAGLYANRPYGVQAIGWNGDLA